MVFREGNAGVALATGRKFGPERTAILSFFLVCMIEGERDWKGILETCHMRSWVGICGLTGEKL
jgi:hypothetical protein